jgi:hypothetical protein
VEERGSSPSWLPVPRPDAGPPALPEPQGPPPPGWLPPGPPPPGPPPPGGQEPSSGPRPRFGWRRFARSPRGATGLAVLAAALLLWPFSGLSWIPWLIGLGALVVLRVLRLDGPLRGWDLPLAGLAVVVGLMLSTGPWAWALATSIGVLLAGLAQLPWWRLAAAGAVLCLISGVGYGVSAYQDRAELAAIRAQADAQMRGSVAVKSHQVLPGLVEAISERVPDPELLCLLMAPSAEEQLSQAVGSENCAAAAVTLHTRYASAPRTTDDSSFPPGDDLNQPPPPNMILDGCHTAWADVAGPELGRVQVQLLDANLRTYTITGFLACQQA